MEPISADAGRIADFFVGKPSFLRHPLALASSGMWSLRDASTLAESLFEDERARASSPAMRRTPFCGWIYHRAPCSGCYWGRLVTPSAGLS